MPPFDDDVRELEAPPITARAVPLEVEEQRTLERLARRYGLTEQGVLRLSLQLLDEAPRGKRWG
jgi:hypothetical protein